AGRGGRAKPLGFSLLSGAITLGLAAVLLLPLVEALPHTAEHFMRSRLYAHVDKSVSVAESLRRSIPDVVPYAFGVSGHGRSAIGFGEPAAYVGSVLFPFAAIGLFSRRREKWPILVLTLVGLAMWARLPVVTDAISSLPLFDIGLNERMVFLAAFGISALAGLGAERFLEKNGFSLLSATFATLVVVLLLHREVSPTLIRLEVDPAFLRARLLAEIVPLILLAGVAMLSLPGRRNTTVLFSALVLLALQRRLEGGDLYPTFPNRAFYPDLAVLDPIPRDAPWRFAATGYQFIPNISAMYELEDVRGYVAMTFLPLTNTFSLWCVPQPIWFNRVDDPTTPFLAFLNVRWVLTSADWTAPPGWKVLAQGDGTRLYENPRALPRAFVPRTLSMVPEEAQPGALASIADFADRGVFDSPDPEWRVGAWRANGAATVRIESYRPQRLDLVVDARSKVVVGTSIPRWPGWRLEIDGRRAPLFAYNAAFLGFEVPAGSHRAVMRYLPDGFLAGYAISSATAAVCFVMIAARRRRPSRENGARREPGAPRPG
ncbi:MAG TPA: YfhO family protein, partial [Thermoanaerobaculia bacterium]|nr:YfhO family protein [Thermoanaerobaculia bacterium]